MLLAKKMSNTSYFGTSLHREKKQYLNTVNTQRWHVQQTKQSPCHQTMVMLWLGKRPKYLTHTKKGFQHGSNSSVSAYFHFLAFCETFSHKFMILDKNNFFHAIWGGLPIPAEHMFLPLGGQQHTLAADTRRQQAKGSDNTCWTRWHE